ncbi:hypothetical protein GCM10022421_21960 [Oceanisphaera sediminis]|uniref:Uncharacterized protein n=1 Tax=Oceanisphaera sediminis TaxID=981381 RepID=A0ABP7E4L1_9GAMM
MKFFGNIGIARQPGQLTTTTLMGRLGDNRYQQIAIALEKMLNVDQKNITRLFYLSTNTQPPVALYLLIRKQVNMPEFRLGNISWPIKGNILAKGFWSTACFIGKKEIFQALGFFLAKSLNQGKVQFNGRRNNA